MVQTQNYILGGGAASAVQLINRLAKLPWKRGVFYCENLSISNLLSSKYLTLNLNYVKVYLDRSPCPPTIRVWLSPPSQTHWSRYGKGRLLDQREGQTSRPMSMRWPFTGVERPAPIWCRVFRYLPPDWVSEQITSRGKTKRRVYVRVEYHP
jgi:hypothetical protein